MKKILITGWCSGLWWEIAQEALRKWYLVDILDISPSNKESIMLSEGMSFFQCDVSQVSETLIQTLGIYDVVICNAGISLSWDFLEHSLSQEASLFRVNTLWHMQLIRLLLTHDKICRWGAISCIISASEMLPFPIALWYAASKWALNWFARALRSYLIGRHISVSCVYPGPMPTAHVKYYGQNQKNDLKSLKKVQKIARKVLRGTEKKKRNIYPDIVSKCIKIISPFGYILDRVMYQSYKEKFQK